MPALLEPAPRPSLIDEPRLTLTEAARRVPCHVSAIYRWASTGVHGVKLPITRIGGKSFVLLRDLERFIRARSDAQAASDEPAGAADRAEAAGRQLKALGI